MDKIILLGYMGSGKTLIAKLLAQKTGLAFKDLDELIASREKMTIPELFESKGEIYFRKAEHFLFKELMATNNPFVLSLGGGTPCYANNHEFLKGEGVVSIYLKANIETLFERLAPNKSQRPLIANQTNEGLRDFIAKQLFERSYFYHQASHVISVDSKTPETIVSEICRLLF